MYKMQGFGKGAAGALVLSFILAACGGGGGDNGGSGSAAPATASSSSSSVASAASSSSVASTALAGKTWTFSDAAYSAAGTTLFTADYAAGADNGIKALTTDITTGAVTVDGLIFNSTAASVLRYRPAGSTSNATGNSLWNTNGSFFTANTPVLPAVGTDITTVGNIRTYMAVPVTTGAAFTVTVSYKQTSSSYTAGKIALVGSNNVLLIAQDAPYGTEGTITYSGAAGHSLSSVKIFYSRESTSAGGVNITQIVRSL